MNYLLASEDGGFNTEMVSDLTPEDTLVLLISVEREKLAAEFESYLKKRVLAAENLHDQLKLRGIISKVLIEWGNAEEVIAACLAREQAILLK